MFMLNRLRHISINCKVLRVRESMSMNVEVLEHGNMFLVNICINTNLTEIEITMKLKNHHHFYFTLRLNT